MDESNTLADAPPPRPSDKRSSASPRLVVAMECERPLQAPSSHSLAELDEVIIGRGDARHHERVHRDGRRILHIRIPSRHMSSTHFSMYRRDGRWQIEDAGSKNGTFIDGDTVRSAAMKSDALIEAGRTIFLYRDRDDWKEHANGPGRSGRPARADLDLAADCSSREAGSLATLSAGLDFQYSRLARVAASVLPVVIAGETGTGKEVAARAIHRLSRRSGPFVAINCGALPEALIESELFGHEKGAFSGADERRPGLFRSAEGGTIFLDEIAELELSSQVSLLRVLQEGEVRPIGGTRATRIDVRVVAATLRDLPARVESGAFRRDLYARLAAVTIELPPLRERREDIGLLCGALLSSLARSGKTRAHLDQVRIERTAARALFAYGWPLNIRELEHALAAALALADHDEIVLDNLPTPVRAALDSPPRPSPVRTREQTLHDQLSVLLEEHRGNVSAVARAMGKAPMQIYRWLKRLHIDAADYRS